MTTEHAKVSSLFLRTFKNLTDYIITAKYIMHPDSTGHFPISTVLIVFIVFTLILAYNLKSVLLQTPPWPSKVFVKGIELLPSMNGVKNETISSARLLLSIHMFSDINECLLNNGNCSQSCTNINGSYTCSCQLGYNLNANNGSCNGR